VLEVPRDFTRAWGDAGLDAQFVQACLVKVQSAQSTLGDALAMDFSMDGTWAQMWVASLGKYAAQWKLPMSTAVVIPALVAHAVHGVVPTPK
jgi:hypothetical protein